jgi:hypothetical protein
MRMQSLLRNDMFQSDLGSILDILQRQLRPIVRCRSGFRRSVDDAPGVVFVAVRVERDLLFCEGSVRLSKCRGKETYACFQLGKSVRGNAGIRLGY